MDLPEQISDSIEDLCQQGSDFFDASKFCEAVDRWSTAIGLLPNDRREWDAYTWLSASIGDAQYQMGEFADASVSLADALNGPGGSENPFVYYRQGQSLIQLGLEDSGIQCLLKAYMLDGQTIFFGESDGIQYLDKLRLRGLVD